MSRVEGNGILVPNRYSVDAMLDHLLIEVIRNCLEIRMNSINTVVSY